MHALILAGGEGSRLAADGVPRPKPLTEVGGEAQLLRLVRRCGGLGAESVTVMVRAEFAPEARTALAEGDVRVSRIEPCTTPSSLHTLVEGLRLVPPGPVFCTMVDTVMPASDWVHTWRATREVLAAGSPVVLAVTGHVDDEAPLWVRRDADGYAIALGASPVTPPCVTGGVYGFGAAARDWAEAALEGGRSRMRAFLAACVERAGRVPTIAVPRIIDLDRRQDLEAAEAWMATWAEGER